MSEPPKKLRRTEVHDKTTTPVVMTLKTALAADDAVVGLILYDSGAYAAADLSEPLDIVKRHILSEADTAKLAVPLVTFDVAELLKTKPEKVEGDGIDTPDESTCSGSKATSVVVFVDASDVSGETLATKQAESAVDASPSILTTSDLSELPRFLLLYREQAPRVMLSKHIQDAGTIFVSALVKPVFTVAHMHRVVLAAAQESVAAGRSPSYSLMWMSAAWCPPCLRIMAALPDIKAAFPSSIAAFFKADMDLAQPIFDLFGVDIIPTFVILDNYKFLQEHDKGASHGDALVASKVASLQNSQQATVMTFIEKHCATLSFGNGEEDF